MTLKKKIIVAAVILFIIAQFFQPHKNQSGFDTVDQFLVDTQAPKDVKHLMELLILIFLETLEVDGVEYPLIKMEISRTSHPYYTGKSKLVDTAGRIDKFKTKYAKFKK